MNMLVLMAVDVWWQALGDTGRQIYIPIRTGWRRVNRRHCWRDPGSTISRLTTANSGT